MSSDSLPFEENLEQVVKALGGSVVLSEATHGARHSERIGPKAVRNRLSHGLKPIALMLLFRGSFFSLLDFRRRIFCLTRSIICLAILSVLYTTYLCIETSTLAASLYGHMICMGESAAVFFNGQGCKVMAGTQGSGTNFPSSG